MNFFGQSPRYHWYSQFLYRLRKEYLPFTIAWRTTQIALWINISKEKRLKPCIWKYYRLHANKWLFCFSYVLGCINSATPPPPICKRTLCLIPPFSCVRTKWMTPLWTRNFSSKRIHGHVSRLTCDCRTAIDTFSHAPFIDHSQERQGSNKYWKLRLKMAWGALILLWKQACVGIIVSCHVKMLSETALYDSPNRFKLWKVLVPNCGAE